MATILITEEDAVKALTENWAACSDALGLVRALEDMRLLAIDRPPSADELLTTARAYTKPGACVEVSVQKTGEMALLIGKLSSELQRRLDADRARK